MPRPLSNKSFKPVESFSPSAQKRQTSRYHFIAAWVRAPMKMGAVVPSSRKLSSALAEQVDRNNLGMVVELGAGTGVVTHALLHEGIGSDRLLVVERDPRLFGVLSSHFHHLRVVCGDAMALQQLLREQKVDKVNAIVSSLPLLGMPKEIRNAIEQEMLATICAHGGRIIQFTYGPNSPITVANLKRFQVVGRRVKFVMANIPPAHIWVYQPKNLHS